MENENHELFASCLAGLERPLADELRRLGCARIRPLAGGVSFSCDVRRALSACLWSRLASRITLVVGRVNAADAPLLYEGVRRLSWEEVVARGASIAVQAHGTNAELRNTRFTALKVKDAVCDRLREARGSRPDVNAAAADAAIDVRVRDGRATVSLDLSGASLYRRSYLDEEDGPDAALECGRAAGLLALAGWERMAREGAAFVDPACGDGALAMEAALVACDLAPGLARDAWGFAGWACADKAAWEELLADADARFERGLADATAPGTLDGPSSAPPDPAYTRFGGACTSSPAVARARARARRAGLRQALSFEFVDAREMESLVGRLRAAKGAPTPEGGARACLVASVEDPDAPAASDARALERAASFSAAARAASGGSRFALVGFKGMEARFGCEPVVRAQLGRDRVAADVLVFDRPPRQAATVMVPDTAGGAQRRVEVLEPNSEQFAARLRKNAKERRKWASREGVGCYRVYDADLPDYAVAIDVYTGAGRLPATFTCTSPSTPRLRASMPARRVAASTTCSCSRPRSWGVRPDHVFSKVRERDRGGSQYRDAGRRPYVTHVEEDGLLSRWTFRDALTPGCSWTIASRASLWDPWPPARAFLNLFGYTGTATVHAAAGGAAQTVTVDLSQTYLDWAARNMGQNGFDGAEHSYAPRRRHALDHGGAPSRSPLRPGVR